MNDKEKKQKQIQLLQQNLCSIKKNCRLDSGTT
jgi:hypothetical protein